MSYTGIIENLPVDHVASSEYAILLCLCFSLSLFYFFVKSFFFFIEPLHCCLNFFFFTRLFFVLYSQGYGLEITMQAFSKENILYFFLKRQNLLNRSYKHFYS